MRGQWLHVPKDWPEVPGLEPVLKRDIDLEFIQSELDELLRMAASINDGYGSATFLLERYGSAAQQSKLHRAARSSGNCGMRFICATTPRSRPFEVASTGCWSVVNPSTCSSASFTPVPFASIAGAGGMRKS